ncbi:MAG: ABC-type cobalamin/Fe3+-siderophore transport system, ATPase component [Methanocalculus sp. 52_23]|nr:MAG: ABC-type cobalamin/Fe3+-siderophore transport system, ATPase component [Methanocalculus sp. 52_23]
MILEVANAGFSYPGGSPIFSDVSFSLKGGEVLCILGPNGIGKSTLIRCLANLHSLCYGSIHLFGKDMAKTRPVDIAKKIGYVPQAHEIVFPFSVRDFVLMGRAPHLAAFSSPGREDFQKADEKIELVGITKIAEKPVNEISGGEYQLAVIARALTQDPSILLLDEPTSHLDFGNQIKVLDIIDRLVETGLSVIMSSHFPDHAFLTSNNVAIMQYGSFMAYGLAEDVVTEENLRQTYGVDVSISFCPNVARHICVPHRSGKCRCHDEIHSICRHNQEEIARAGGMMMR